MELNKVQSINQILNTKIIQISQLRKLLTKELFEIQSALQIKNRIIQYFIRHSQQFQSLKMYYRQFTQLIHFIHNHHIQNIHHIQSLNQYFQNLIHRLKNTYTHQINQLQNQLQSQYKIAKLIKQQNQSLRQKIQKLENQKKQSQNISQNSIIKICNSLLLKNNKDQDQLVLHSAKEPIKKGTLSKKHIQSQPFITLQRLQTKLNQQQQHNSDYPQLVLEQYRKSFVKSNNLNLMNLQQNLNNHSLLKNQINQTQLTNEFQIKVPCTSQITTPTLKNTKQNFIGKNFFTQNNSQQQDIKIKKGFTQNGKQYKIKIQEQKFGLSEAKKRRRYDSQNSKSLKKSKSKNIHQEKYRSILKNIINVKNNAINIIDKKKDQIYTLYVGDKKSQTRYQGQKKQGKKHGKGVLYYSVGFLYEGQFRDNIRYGFGVLRFNHIQIYKGLWFNDMIHGKGKIKNCKLINKKNNKSNNVFNEWVTYQGQFKQNRFDGEGCLMLNNGQKFEGKFKNGIAQLEDGRLYKKNGEVQFTENSKKLIQYQI